MGEFELLVRENPVKALKALVEEFEDNFFDGDYSMRTVEDFDREGISLKLVHAEGGYEGEGDHAERVIAFMLDEKPLAFVEITGSYSSYNGTEWDDEYTQVYPHQVTITVYKNTKPKFGSA